MRELDRELNAHTPLDRPLDPGASVGVVGAGRLGTVLARSLREAGCEVHGPVGRGVAPAGEILLLCVPDAEIASAADTVAGAARFVGHTSGATSLAALAPAAAGGAELFGFHPLQTFARPGARLVGSGCAVAGSTPRAAAAARDLAATLGMTPFHITDADRAAYHAAASIASNFLITLEEAAERMAGAAGVVPTAARGLLAPLVRTTVENWAALGPERALTGPVARGDEATIRAQRSAVAEAAPDLLPLFDVLVERTRALAARHPHPAGALA
jgi:predicted short-subunit dehydrogenase-like oxidoreductase (DUF2520 family)